MANLQAGIAYWLSVVVLATQTFPSFLGGNWVGLLLAFVGELYRRRVEVSQKIAVLHRSIKLGSWKALRLAIRFGWRGIMTDWKSVLTIVGLFLLGNILTEAYKDHASVADRLEASKLELRSAQARVREGDQSCQLKANEIGRERDKQSARNETLEKQNRDQQSSINNCINQALKLVSPELKVTPLKFDQQVRPDGIETIRWIVLVNKDRTPPAQINITCNQPIEGNSRVSGLGAGALIFSGSATRVAPNAISVNVVSASWSPTSPLQISASFRRANNVICDFHV